MKQLTYTLLLLASVGSPAWSEEPVHFADDRLRGAVEAELWISDPTPTDMLGLTSLNAGYEGITSLTGLECALNLQVLVINWNQIRDVSPLAGLTNLEELVLHGNPLDGISALSGLVGLRHLDLRTTGISDLSPACTLQNLKELDAWGNDITDISSLSCLPSLEMLWLGNNRIGDISVLSQLTMLRGLFLRVNDITDISPLLGLTHLANLDLLDNPLDSSACASYISLITANNPGILFEHGPCMPYRLTISSSPGGRVVRPGEGEFLYDSGEVVTLEAQADPCFVFASWSGDWFAADPVLRVTIDRDRTVRANFRSTSDVLYVADGTPADPSATVAEEDDSQENGSAEQPFGQIQQAIGVAAEGASIIVAPGVYHEKIDFLGKSIRLIGIQPDDPAAIAWPILDGSGTDTVVNFIGGEDANALLRGFVITRGTGLLAGAINCVGSSPTIANCLIVGNRATDAAGGAIYCANSRVQFLNCTIANNHGGEAGAGIALVDSPVSLTNSILWGNAPQEIRKTGVSEASMCCSDVAGGCPGSGNIDADPLFAQAGYWVDGDHPGVLVGRDYFGALWVLGDCHLRSQAGRWDPKAGAWVQDAVTSPCVDAGDPASAIGAEPAPNGGIINIGAYGGTAQASRTYPSP
jgi:hypothetical protein